MAESEQLTLRQRKQATASGIERSAVALVLAQGLENVTVDMICEASGVSQRTFFNYFRTKDAAILGDVPPKLDEQRVREFLASDRDDLFPELFALMVSMAPVDTSDLDLAGKRMRIISENPVLLQKEMERLFAIRAELEEILFLRIRRTAPTGETEAETRSQASLITHVMAGLLRFALERSIEHGMSADDVRNLFTRALGRLLGSGAR
jgi:AcrR family transcriptional regulator